MQRSRLVVIGACLAFGGCARTPPTGPAVETVQIAGERFELEVASDAASVERGLMGRTEVPPGTGMLFVFQVPGVLSFWMKDCLVDIDIVFLDPRGRVTATQRMKAESPKSPTESDETYRSRLPRYSSGVTAQFAIEIPAGSLDRLRVAVEDRIELDLDRLKALAAAADQP